jgi:hypothetical protein
MPSERISRLRSGRTVVLRSPPLPLVRNYHVLAWVEGQGAPTIAEIDEMWAVAHAIARELGATLYGDPECFSVLFNGERTRRKAWPHFHLILARTPGEKRWALLCLACKRWLRVLRRNHVAALRRGTRPGQLTA